jgi:proline iminopeptidase
MSNERLSIATMKDPVSWLYPPIEPYHTDRLRVSSVHELYFEQSGKPDGKPVVFLHGGPGGGSEPKQRRFFRPEKYRVVCFDQRGCGKSTPYASLDDNTTWDLVADIEKLRTQLGIERWQVFGGSWGSTLALAYAERHPERVTELILRGIFLLRRKEIEWFYQRGASILYPDAWEPYLAHIPETERGDLLTAYHRRLTSEDAHVRLSAAKIWSGWEGATSKLLPDVAFTSHYEEDDFALAFARIEAHYFINRGFLESDDQLLRDAVRIRALPGVIVQGRYDVVCPIESAWALHRAWPEADLVITPDSGHSAFDPPNTRALVAAADKFASC